MLRLQAYNILVKASGSRYRRLFTCTPGQGVKELLAGPKSGLIPLSFGGVLTQVGMRLALKK